MKFINILGLNIHVGRPPEFYEKIGLYLASPGQHRIVTPNPEIILSAIKNEEYFYIINTADLAVPDGIGLKFAAWALGRNLHRVTGVDLCNYLLALAEKKHLKVAVFNWRQGLSSAREIQESITRRFPGLEILVVDVDRGWGMPYYEKANRFEPAIIFNTLGAPWQDILNYRILPKLPAVKLAIGVGGAFDFFTGKIPRAPKLFRALGLEWLWRLAKQPWRWRRIYCAVVIFPLKFCRWRFLLPFLYRNNVAILLYKKTGNDYHFLIVERQEDPGHWQLPQGGIDGQNIMEAGLKELAEETGCTRIRPVRSFKNLYLYKFGYRDGETSHRGSLARKHVGYKGQRQSLLIAEFLGQDSDIRIKYWDHSAWRWVKRAQLLETVHIIRKEATAKYLKKFDETIKEKS